MSEILSRMRPEKKFEPEQIIIAGANIAGCVAAIELGRAGRQVILLDKTDPREEQKTPPCNGCGGIIQGKTARILEELGVPIHDITRRKLDGFIVTLTKGEEITVDAPMRSVYRGHGPLNAEAKSPGLDAKLLESALKYPTVQFYRGEISSVDLSLGNQSRVRLKGGIELRSDFFIGAFGHSKLAKNVKVLKNEKLDAPITRRSTVIEYDIGEDLLNEEFGSYARIMVLPFDKLKKSDSSALFVLLAPKNDGAMTMVIMGDKDITSHDVNQLLESENLKKALSANLLNKIKMKELKRKGGCGICTCTINTITLQSPEHYLINRMGGGILIGDAGLTRLYKDGIGAAVATAREAALSIIKGDFSSYRRKIGREYPPDDHFYAERYLRLNDAVISNPHLRRLLMLANNTPAVSQLLIDPHMRHFLTGDVAYKNILPSLFAEMLFKIFDM